MGVNTTSFSCRQLPRKCQLRSLQRIDTSRRHRVRSGHSDRRVRLRRDAWLELIADKDAVVLDSATGALVALSWRVKEASDCLRAAKIEHQNMRMVGRTAAPLRVPETCRLPVNRVVGAAILTLRFFTVHAGDSPTSRTQWFAIGANQGKL